MTKTLRCATILLPLFAGAFAACGDSSGGTASLSSQGQLVESEVDETSEFFWTAPDACDEPYHLGVTLFALDGRVLATAILSRDVGIGQDTLHDEDASAWRVWVDGEEQDVTWAVFDASRPDWEHVEGTLRLESDAGSILDADFVLLVSPDPDRGGPAPSCEWEHHDPSSDDLGCDGSCECDWMCNM